MTNKNFIIHTLTDEEFKRIEALSTDLYIVDDADKKDKTVVMSRDLVRMMIHDALSTSLEGKDIDTVTPGQLYSALSTLMDYTKK